MVAVVHQSRSLKNALNYNEQKQNKGKASCLLAVNYPKDASQLTFNQKLNRLTRQAGLNERTRVNTVHISLNFSVGELLPVNRLKKIAEAYMQKIGFGEQPYLVYQHTDASHPHLHIVTTNIQPDGKRISLHNIGKNKSEKARKEIEQEFDLVKADEQKIKQAFLVKPANVPKALYGKSETRRAIINVLDGVLSTYKYTSLPELNAVLQLYNVQADPGGENSRIFRNNGLVYRLLDEQGNKVGVPIKASLIYNNPGLAFLKEKFVSNESQRIPHKRHLRTTIDWILSGTNTMSLKVLEEALQKEQIDLVLRKNKEGILYGITYIDHKHQCVFNGSDLGKAYSANGLQERCAIGQQSEESTLERQQVEGKMKKKVLEKKRADSRTFSVSSHHKEPRETTKALLQELLQPADTADYMPYELTYTGKKRKKKKKQR